MKKYFLTKLIAMVVSLFGLPSLTAACQWVGGQPPSCFSYAQAELVFAGKVIEISKERNEPGERLPIATVTFLVERMYKGLPQSLISIQAVVNMCYQKYSINQRFLIYAAHTSEGGLRDIRSRLLPSQNQPDSAKEDFDFLQNLLDGKRNNAIHGFVYKRSSTPIKDVLIVVERGGLTYKTFTREDGYFSIPSVQPGVYTIRCTVPAPTLIAIYQKGMKSKKLQNFNIAEIEVIVPQSGCSYTQFELWSPMD